MVVRPWRIRQSNELCQWLGAATRRDGNFRQSANESDKPARGAAECDGADRAAAGGAGDEQDGGERDDGPWGKAEQ